MADNEVVLLNQVLEERQIERAVKLPPSEAFELFASEQTMRDRDLSSDEVTQGILGGSDDGGIDSVYVFFNDVLLEEDSEIFNEDFKVGGVAAGPRLELCLIQAKEESSFTETAIDKVASSLNRFLALENSEEDLEKLYSPLLVARIGLFRKSLLILAKRHPKVHINFSYVTKGKVDRINPKVLVKGRDLEAQLRSVITGATASVDFLGAAELWIRASKIPSYTTELVYQENATSEDSHVALVKLQDYMKFLKDDNGDLRRHIFDLNVRDYQGAVEVNKEISASLEDPDAPEFWWLNNGVTIVCSNASIISKKYVLDDVQIVNGLQSSHTIFKVLNDAAEDHPAQNRSILVRILVTGDDPAIRDQVIRATNRQTSVPAASLRATDQIQRKIEAFFLQHDWFYDRRKNYYRNIGKSPDRIVGIPLLSQATMAMGLSRPNDSRARPSSLLKRDDEYDKIFSDKFPLEVYLWIARTQKDIDSFLLSSPAGVATQERTNLKFHLSMVVVGRLVGRLVYSPAQLKDLASANSSVNEGFLKDSLTSLREAFMAVQASTGANQDKVAKGPELVEYLKSTTIPELIKKDADASVDEVDKNAEVVGEASGETVPESRVDAPEEGVKNARF